MPFLVDLGGLEAKPTHPRVPSRSAAQRHLRQVAGINRNGWPDSAGLGGRFAPDWVAGFGRNAHFVGETLARLSRAGASAVVLRADSGFYQRDVIDACRRRGAGFSIGARMQKGMAQAISAIPEAAWVPIDYPYGQGAAVAELAWEPSTVTTDSRRVPGIAVRLIVRRVPPSPGIQAPLFPTFSYHPFITDQAGDIAELDRFHREHARVENVIKDLKGAAGLEHLPSGRFGANSAWLVLATIAHNLARWVGRYGMGEGHRMLKTVRRRALAVPGRITRSGRRRTLHLPARWPWDRFRGGPRAPSSPATRHLKRPQFVVHAGGEVPLSRSGGRGAHASDRP